MAFFLWWRVYILTIPDIPGTEEDSDGEVGMDRGKLMGRG
jgi:hypothetical protein